MKSLKSVVFRISLSVSILTVMLSGTVDTAKAAADLAISPLTWNVIGLDSNNVNVGPNHFPIGVRVCNSGDAVANNVKSAFHFTTADPYIDLRDGTLADYTDNGIDLNPGSCTDFYYEVEVSRDSDAYDHTREYYITASADGGLSAATDQPRELYVEHLISQSRNSVDKVYVNGSEVAPGGIMTLMVGQTYTIRLEGFTATNGYEQIESFINFPNTIFQVLDVATTYTADTSAYVTSPDDRLYGDGCLWENDPEDPNYQACLETGKAGGAITVTYTVKILRIPETPFLNPQGLNTLIYDFSGSSFHYNSDFSVSTRYVRIVNASIDKDFTPKTIHPNGSSTLTFIVANPGPDQISGLHFTDNLPVGVSVDATAVTYTDCGTPSPSSLTIGDTSLSFSDITVNGYTNCQIDVSVTSAADGTYLNTSTNLFIGTADTSSSASDTLFVISRPPAPSTCTSPVTLATWTMPASGQGSGGPPPPYTTIDGDVSFADADSSGGTSTIVAGGITTNAWRLANGWHLIDNPPTAASTPYFEFSLDTSNYGGISINFAYDLEGNGDWASGNNNVIYVHTQADSDPFQAPGIYTATKGSWQSGANSITHSASTSGLGTTTFRINVVGAPSNKPNAVVLLDNIIITGCPRADMPTLTKAFSPDTIPAGSPSSLAFTISNPNSSITLHELAFSDILPAGLEVADPNGLTTTCNSTVSAVSGSSLISWSGGSLAPSASCTISVDVLGTAAGAYSNISDTITSTETGPNTTLTGYGTDTLTVVGPPEISKYFGTNDVVVSNTTTLTFVIENANIGETLTDISFSDTLPAGLDVTPMTSSQCGGTMTATDNDPAQDAVTLVGGSLAAGGTCSFSVTVTGATTGLKQNSVTVSSGNGGIGNTAEANLLVRVTVDGMSLTKQVSDSSSGPWRPFISVSPGDDVYYRMVVENTGDNTQTNVGISDPDLDTSGCEPYTLPAPAPGSEAHIAACVIGPIPGLVGSHTNTAQAYSDQIPLGSPNTPEDSAVYLGAQGDLSLLKQIGTSSTGPWSSAITGISAGGNVYYSFDVINTGNIPLTDLAITDPDVDATSCAFTDPLGVGDSTSCVVGPVTAETAIGIYTNTAFATAKGQDPYEPVPGTTYTSNESSASYTLVSPDLTIAKANDTADSGAVGASFTWSIMVSNNGDQSAVFSAGQVVVADSLPSGATYANLGDPGLVGLICSLTASPDQLQCEADVGGYTLLASDSFIVSVDVTPTGGGNLVNLAVVDPDGNIDESDETNNTDTDTVAIAALSVAKVYVDYTDLDTSGDLSLGDALNFTATVTNDGNVTLTNVTVDDPDLTPTHQSCASLAPGGTCVLTGSHTVTQADVDAGSFVNTATGDSDETGPDTDQVTTPIGQSPALGIAKSSPTTTVTTAGQVVPYDYVITNTGNVTLTNLTLADNNTDNPPVCVPPQPATLAPGNLMNCTAQHTVTLAEFNTGGNLTNIATADSDQTVPVQVTLDIPIVRIFDPPFGTKEFDDTGLPLLRWTMIWINDSNTAPLDAEVHDPIPAGTTYVLGSVSCAAEGTSTTSTCAYDGITDEIVWIGTIGDDLGATDAASAANEVVITFQVTIPDTINTAFNLSTLDADLNDDGVIDPADGEVLVASASAVWVRSALPQVPETGFAPGVVTNLPAQPLEKAYQDLGQVWLEIPALQLRISITGVPIVDGDWDVSWLDREAGWLNGTAFPGYAGNSVITAHVYLPSGLPGPFVNLDKLSWDDKVIVHAFGQQYIYQVRSNQFVQPDNTIATRHEQYPWLTLLTCRGFNDGSGRYNYRVMIRAVLIEVRTDYIH